MRTVRWKGLATDELPRVILDNHHHLWTDVLHARALAGQTHAHWDRGSYVRWAVVFACIVLEMSCQEAMDDPSISYSFRQKLDAAIATHGYEPLDWGSGLWQDVTRLRSLRGSYVHRFTQAEDLFPAADEASWAIEVVRRASKDVYSRARRIAPQWLDEDGDRGWQGPGMPSDFGVIGAVEAGVDTDAPDTVRVAYVWNDRECDDRWMPPGSDYVPQVARLLRNTNVPISEIRVYEGSALVYSVKTRMRGT